MKFEEFNEDEAITLELSDEEIARREKEKSDLLKLVNKPASTTQYRTMVER